MPAKDEPESETCIAFLSPCIIKTLAVSIILFLHKQLYHLQKF